MFGPSVLCFPGDLLPYQSESRDYIVADPIAVKTFSKYEEGQIAALHRPADTLLRELILVERFF